MAYSESELILNPDGSIYHIALKDEWIADKVIVVGDQNRVERISKHFQTVERRVSNREFVTHTGFYNGKRITVLSTGIGIDNIDIVINELDAAVNIDLSTREEKTQKRVLDIVRVGTCGALREDLPVDEFLVSQYGLGIDGLQHFYDMEMNQDETILVNSFARHTQWNETFNKPYAAIADEALFSRIVGHWHRGITVTANGFYGPQGRALRLNPKRTDLNDLMGSFVHNGAQVSNYEMETSALYALGRALGHRCCTVCAVIANRIRGEYSKDYKKTVDELILQVLDRI